MDTITLQTQSTHLTEDQFFRLCVENKELRFERDPHKNIIIMSPTGSFTSNYHSKFLIALGNWNEKYKLGYVFDSSAGFTLPNGAVRAADAAWISKKRWETVPLTDKKRFAHICPDFVIEVLSETDSLKQQQEKMQEWIENGCRMGWLIDLEHRTTYVYQPNTETTERNFKQILSGEVVLPGFKLKLNRI